MIKPGRTEEEMAEVAALFSDAYAQEFERPLSVSDIKDVVHEIEKERLRAFILQRLGHLPTKDFIRIVPSLSKPKSVPIEPEVKRRGRTPKEAKVQSELAGDGGMEGES